MWQRCGCHVVGKRETREDADNALVSIVHTRMLGIASDNMQALQSVHSMLVPGLESQSPEWTSTVSTGRVGGKKRKDDEE